MNAPAETTDPTQKLTRAAAKAETRRRVLEGARAFFISNAYDQVTMRDLARAIGMSTGAIFANFKDKEELFLAVVKPDADGYQQQAGKLPRVVGRRTAAVKILSIDYEPSRLVLLRTLQHLALGSAKRGAAYEALKERKNAALHVLGEAAGLEEKRRVIVWPIHVHCCNLMYEDDELLLASVRKDDLTAGLQTLLG